MNDSPSSGLRSDLQIALEASCDALVAMQLVRSNATDRSLRAAAMTAISALRRAITELRAAEDAGTSLLASGFVLERRTGSDDAPSTA
jgi:hypothetical protein